LLVALAETLTVNRLGIAGRLLGDRGARQPLESIELVRDHAGRVQRWSSGDGAAPAAAGMHATEAQFRPGRLDLAVTA
jgi:hypothetical protein